jgi:hypothetical protein
LERGRGLAAEYGIAEPAAAIHRDECSIVGAPLLLVFLLLAIDAPRRHSKRRKADILLLAST